MDVAQHTHAPTRFGSDFRRLLASSWVTNAGDGISLAAGPLLVASQSRAPFLVASAALLHRLPWLIFGLYAGAVADRVDRRKLVAGADIARALVLVALSASVLSGRVDIAVVLVTMFVLGVAEVFGDTTSATLPPMLVDREHLGEANARLQASVLVGNQLLGPPLGAGLFALGMAVPFVAQGICAALGALLLLRLSVRRPPERAVAVARPRTEILQGLRWLARHSAVRTLVLVILTFNITWGAAWSVLVLWAQDRLHAGEFEYGLLISATALGGLLATFGFSWLNRRASYELLMKVCLSCEVAMHGILALTTAYWLAVVVMFGFGAYAFVWATISQTIRQRAVPEEFQGRVSSVYMVGIFGGLVLGQAIGGVIADHFGIVAPFWFAFAGSGLTLALVWRQLAHVARE